MGLPSSFLGFGILSCLCLWSSMEAGVYKETDPDLWRMGKSGSGDEQQSLE